MDRRLQSVPLEDRDELHRGAPLTSPAAIDVGELGRPDVAVVASSAFGDVFAGRPTMPNLSALPL